MSTSANNAIPVKTALGYALAAAFCAFFGAVYEAFSHQVYSYYMIYAFALPLGLGAIPFLWIARFRGPVPSLWSRRLYHAGVAALTVGCVFKGVLEIFGTTNRLFYVYPAAGVPLLLAGLLLYLLPRPGRRGAAS